MKEKKEEKVRVRKERATGERTQKMMTFRVDNELLDWLESQTNKGRYINNLIKADKERQAGNQKKGA